MKRKHYLTISAIAAGFLLCSANSAKAYDYSYDYCMKQTQLYQSGAETDIDEIEARVPDLASACNTCAARAGKNDYAQGTMWLNGASLNSLDYNNFRTSVESMYRSGDFITVNSVHTNEAIVYVHGQVYSCGNDDGLANPNQMNAKWIYILTGSADQQYTTSSGTVKNCGTKGDFKGGAPVSRLNSCSREYVTNRAGLASGSSEYTINRMYGYSGNQQMPQATWSDPAQAIPVKIDITEFKKKATFIGEGSYTKDNVTYEYEEYSDTVWVFRCPLLVSEGTTGDQCGPGDAVATIKLRIITKETFQPTTCREAHQNDPDYGDTYNGAPSWFTSLGIYYNKCYGESVLGTRVSTKNINESNYTERAILKNSDSTRTATVYVKPGTNVQIDQFYFPAAQLVTKTIVDDERLTAKDSNGDPITIPNKPAGKVTLAGSGNISSTWNNSHEIGEINTKTTGYGSVNFTFTRGGYNNAPSFNDSNNTGTVHTGNTITETNSGDSSILGRASVGNLDENGVTNVKKSVESTTVTVIAPYNFTNSVGLSGANFQAGAFAGSEVSFGASYTTNGKNNQWIPGGAYATISPNSKLRLYSFVSDSANPSQNCNPDGDTPAECKTHYSKNNFALNENENPSAKHDTELYTVSIPDVDAGKYFCVVAAVWPTSSGADDNYTNPSGNGQWEIKKQCVRIQKRAFFQVWGGNVYAKGKVSSSTTTKKTVGGTTYSPAITFGSWTEHGIIASKKEVTGVASGAALGYTSNDDGNLINSPGGKSGASKNCRFSTFTIANTDCYINTGINDAATPGYSNIDLSNNLLDLTNYTNTARSTTSRGSSAESQLDLASEYTEKDGIRYTYAVGNLYLKSSAALPKGTTHVVYATGSVYIHSNLNYQNITYSNPSDMPQLIIIAGGNINVDGAVTNIDAWLYTKSGTIDTCTQNNTSSACSRQLRINGPIVAGKMVLDRNYGGGTGNDSGTPAEIINFTPATYIFSQAKSTENTSLRVVYSKEIAPRY